MKKNRGMHKPKAACEDCDRPYGDKYGFPDLIIPYEAWKQISSSGDDSGLLCPSCICGRLYSADIKCEGAFMSGSIKSISEVEMQNLRRIENIELAIEGRNNKWGVLLRPKRNKLAAYLRTMRAFRATRRTIS